MSFLPLKHSAQFEYKNISLFEAVHLASLSKENGCKVVENKSNSIVVYDCYRWDKENNALLLFLKPNAHISILSSVNSLSGFKIIISEQSEPKLFTRFLFLFISVVLFSILCISLCCIDTSVKGMS